MSHITKCGDCGSCTQYHDTVIRDCHTKPWWPTSHNASSCIHTRKIQWLTAQQLRQSCMWPNCTKLPKGIEIYIPLSHQVLYACPVELRNMLIKLHTVCVDFSIWLQLESLQRFLHKPLNMNNTGRQDMNFTVNISNPKTFNIPS
jgi:hypothetical protein